MSNELFRKIGRKLIAAEREHLTEVPIKLIADRVHAAIQHAVNTGFTFQKPFSSNRSLPNLIAYAECSATYSKYVFHAELRIWIDGEVNMIIQQDAVDLFKLRVFKSGLVVQDFNFYKFLHKEAA
jgi:hypothetical protein